jgi:hypothetical protein
MKRGTIHLVIAANLLAILLLAVVAPQSMISPGKLTDAHAELTSDCFACHRPLFGSRPEKCVECHAVAKIGIETTSGLPIATERKSVAFHRELIEEDCVACHSEHRGVRPLRPIRHFSHDLVRAATREQCDGCHRKPGDALHRRIEDNCGECHTPDRWTPATFDHDPYFRFDRDHTTDCITCHVDNDYGSYTCYGCHEHSRAKIREEHLEEGIYDYENCAECHRSGDEDEAKRRMRRGERRPGDADRGSRRRSHDEDEDEDEEHERD